MVYLELKKEPQQKNKKYLQCYAEKMAALKQKKEKEAGGNVGTQGFCRGRGKGY